MDGISMGQGKYVVEILNILRVLYCKEIATPMESNLNLVYDSSL